jgi:hypothetical protein
MLPVLADKTSESVASATASYPRLEDMVVNVLENNRCSRGQRKCSIPNRIKGGENMTPDDGTVQDGGLDDQSVHVRICA